MKNLIVLICKPACVITRPPVLASECIAEPKPGGINRLGFAICGIEGSALENAGWFNDEDMIKQAICDGHLFFTGEILAQKPGGSTTKKRISSCSSEIVVAGTKTITFEDYNSYDPVTIDANYAAGAEYLFWDFIDTYQGYLNMFAISCDGRVFFSANGDWSLEVDETIEQTVNDTSFFAGTVTIQKKGILFGYTGTMLPDTLTNFVVDEDCAPTDYIVDGN